MSVISGLWMTHDSLRLALAGGATAAFAFLCVTAGLKPRPGIDDQTAVDNLVLYASQTGQAEDIARRSHQRLSQGGQRVQVMALGQATPALLQNARRILCVVSTTGQGDAPDEARAFAAQVMTQRPDLAGRDGCA